MGDYYLYAVLVRKPISYEHAKGWSQYIIANPRRIFYKELKKYYKFRNIWKTRFIPDSFIKRKLNSLLTVVYGKLKKDDGMQDVRYQERIEALPLPEGDDWKAGKKMPLQGLPEAVYEEAKTF
jgi:hypothetical protein